MSYPLYNERALPSSERNRADSDMLIEDSYNTLHQFLAPVSYTSPSQKAEKRCPVKGGYNNIDYSAVDIDIVHRWPFNPLDTHDSTLLGRPLRPLWQCLTAESVEMQFPSYCTSQLTFSLPIPARSFEEKEQLTSRLSNQIPPISSHIMPTMNTCAFLLFLRVQLHPLQLTHLPRRFSQTVHLSGNS